MRRNIRKYTLAHDRLAKLEAKREAETSAFHWARIRTDSVKEFLAVAWAAKLAGNDDINPAHLSAEARADFLAHWTTPDDPFNPDEQSPPETREEMRARHELSYQQCATLDYWHGRREAARND